MNIHQVRTLAIVALLFLSNTILLGQTETSLTGKVTDPQGGLVAGAIMTLYARDNGTRLRETTDASGVYRFEHLRPGEYVLEAEASGFARSVTQVSRLQRGGTATQDLTLDLAGRHEEVVVTASGTAQPVDEVSKAITVIGQQEIDDRDEFAISEALRSTPGLRVQQLGGPGAFTSIKTRGLRNEDTAVLIDGLRFRDAAAPQGDASGFMEDLIVTNIDRLEILRGSGSSLYGTNAIGGVINIVTTEGGGRTRGSLLTEGGSLGLFRGRAQLAGGVKNDRLTYSAGVTRLNVSDGIDGDDAARNTSGQGRLNFRFSPSATLSARIYAADSFLQLNTSPQAIGNPAPTGILDAVPLSLSELHRYEAGMPLSQLDIGTATFIPSANDPDNTRKANFFSGALTFTHQPASKLSYTLTYQGLISNRTFSDGPGGVSFQPTGNTQSDLGGRVQTVNARLNYQAGSFNLIDTGYEFENEKFVNRAFPENPADNSTVDVIQRSNTVFLQDQLRLLDGRLQVSAAFRSQFFSLQDLQFTPAASAPYQGLTFKSPPTAYTGDGSVAYFFRKSGTKIRSHVGNGYRAPSLYERFGTFFGSFGYSIFGDPRLRPDRSLAFDAGVDQTLFGSRLRASATYFYTRLQDTILFDFSGAIDPATDPFGRFGGYRNTRGGLARGLELGVKVAPAPSLDVTAAYTYTNADQRQPLVGNLIRSFVIPGHQFSLMASQHLGSRFLINFDFNTSSNYLAPIFDPVSFASRAYRFDGIMKADLGISYRLPLSEFRSIRFYGKVDNLFDRNYYENGFRTPGAAGIAGIEFEF